MVDLPAPDGPEMTAKRPRRQSGSRFDCEASSGTASVGDLADDVNPEIYPVSARSASLKRIAARPIL